MRRRRTVDLPADRRVVMSRQKEVQNQRARRRSYAAPMVRILELDVMQSFPQNCKMDVGMGGFGGAGGPCLETQRPRAWCLQTGS
jgi:hypothetical protein